MLEEQLMARITEDEKLEFQIVFQQFDPQDNGYITKKYLGNALRCLGQFPSKTELEDIILEADKEKSGNIYWADFIGVMTQLKNDKNLIDELIEKFQEYDKDNRG